MLDIEEPLLDLTGMADIVYWPVAMDFKKNDFMVLPEGSVDFGLFNGAVRTGDHLELAHAFRARCKVLVAYGSCACFGGIPGLANLHDRNSIFDTAYQHTPSTENPDALRPQTEYLVNGTTLTLPAFFDTVQSLPQAVNTDVLLPGCPPPKERILDLVNAVRRYVKSGELPPPGTVIAEDKALCDSCPRNESRVKRRITSVQRLHEVAADPRECFLNQGILCMGIIPRATVTKGLFFRYHRLRRRKFSGLHIAPDYFHQVDNSFAGRRAAGKQYIGFNCLRQALNGIEKGWQG